MNYKQQKGICLMVLEAEKSKIKDLHPAVVSRGVTMWQEDKWVPTRQTESRQMCDKPTQIAVDWVLSHGPATYESPTSQHQLYW